MPRDLMLVERPLSGNCRKVQLCVEELGLHCARITPETLGAGAFAEASPRGKVPVLLEEGRPPLVESVAILMRLSRGSHLLPEEDADQILSWLVWDQADLSKPLALPRYYARIGETATRRQEIERLHAEARVGLAHLEARLSGSPFLLGESYSLADLALHVYVGLAGEGGLDIGPYPDVERWVRRIRARPFPP